LSFPVFSTANDVHAPSEPTSQIQDPSDVNEIIQLREDNNVLKKHIFEMSEQYYHWKVACSAPSCRSSVVLGTKHLLIFARVRLAEPSVFSIVRKVCEFII
jgi:hypothetical protein